MAFRFDALATPKNIGFAVCGLLVLAACIFAAFSLSGPKNAQADIAPAAADNTPIEGGPVLGDADAPVTITEYASLTCSHCASFHKDTLPTLVEKYVETGKVRYVFEEFPLDDAALDASLIARCLPQERYLGFTTLLFETQDQWASGDYRNALRQNAKLAGLSDEAFDACLTDQGARTAKAETISAATAKWKISATPTFVIESEGAEAEVISGSQPVAAFDAVIEKRLAPDGQ